MRPQNGGHDLEKKIIFVKNILLGWIKTQEKTNWVTE